MGRKLRHVLILLLIILKEPSMSEETNPGPTAHAVGSTLHIQTQALFTPSAVSVSSFGDPPGPREKPLGSTFPPQPSAIQQKVKTAATITMARVASPFPTTGTSSLLFTSKKPETNRYDSHESFPSVSIPALIGSVCGSAALSIAATFLITIWCKRNAKNPPSGPTSNIALSNINTTATVPTSGSLHDQTGQGQSLASTQPMYITRPSHVRGPAVSQTHYYVDANTPNPKTPKGVPPTRDDDEPTYVEPDGAHYMTPEDVLYQMPANSHCEDDNLHYYQPLKKEQNLPTDASGYVLVVPDTLNTQKALFDKMYKRRPDLIWDRDEPKLKWLFTEGVFEAATYLQQAWKKRRVRFVEFLSSHRVDCPRVGGSSGVQADRATTAGIQTRDLLVQRLNVILSLRKEVAADCEPSQARLLRQASPVCGHHRHVLLRVLPRVQTRLMRELKNRPLLWRDGAKCFDSNVESLIKLSPDGRAVNICVRSEQGDKLSCRQMLEMIENIVINVLDEVSPGTATEDRVLSARALREHREEIYSYSMDQVNKAKEKDGKVHHDILGFSEDVDDLLCGGGDDDEEEQAAVGYSHQDPRVYELHNHIINAGDGAVINMYQGAAGQLEQLQLEGDVGQPQLEAN
ncbi:Unconventional myosin-XVI [Branchiostoma belcheri]|nr:Unconventional myosin-XVI [Branchiostoma belcheri]